MLIGCSYNSGYNDWRSAFIELEDHRITKIETRFAYRSGEFIDESRDTTFETYDSDNRLIGKMNTHFYEYDSLERISKEIYCMRTCEIPMYTVYKYDKKGDLLSKSIVNGRTNDTTVIYQFDYDQFNNLITEKLGSDSLGITTTFNYDNQGFKLASRKSEFNSNTNEWVITLDSFFYDQNHRIIRTETRTEGVDILKISRFYYDNNIETRIDTAITSLKSYQLDNSVNWAHHVNYGKTKKIFDEFGRVIEQVIFKPDYKTPYMMWRYTYSRTDANSR